MYTYHRYRLRCEMKIGKQGKAPVKLKRTTTTSQKIGAIIRVIVLIGLLVGIVWSQNNLVITKDYTYKSDRIPKTFVGYTIAHVTDLHNTSVNAIGAVDRCNPDLILVTGGLVDDSNNFKHTAKDIKKLASIAPTYYVLGAGDTNFRNEIAAAIGDSAVLIEDGAVSINAPKVDESAFIDKYIGSKIVSDANNGDELAKQYIEYTKKTLMEDANKTLLISGFTARENNAISLEEIYEVIGTDKEVFQVSMAHQIGLYDDLSNADIDIVFSGETHGTNAINSSYKKGVYNRYGTTLFLNGGVGNNSKYPSRIMNYPEVIAVTLSDGTIKDENPLEKLLSHFISDVGTKFDDDGGFKEYTYEYGNSYYVEPK